MAFDDVPKPPSSHIENPRITSAAKESQQQAHTLVLYSRKSCPYCRRVLDYLNKEGKTVAIFDADESPAIAEELIRIGGKQQFPCLVIDGKAMYESLAIIDWLEKNRDLY
ncbi:MAG: glutaredoxin domain-containing protein [Chlamydiota bacterium]